ncbi:MAG: hypothetical protein H6799_03225 [Candidatus Nomurabacteria bacterium]|nr:MAG: hypothetical protein H6799_03225 [Candidatus Nomurabacteria bacterium]HRV75796.1 hypothetical protein [Candidatus Saccharimonadales bacterium]
MALVLSFEPSPFGNIAPLRPMAPGECREVGLMSETRHRVAGKILILTLDTESKFAVIDYTDEYGEKTRDIVSARTPTQSYHLRSCFEVGKPGQLTVAMNRVDSDIKAVIVGNAHQPIEPARF